MQRPLYVEQVTAVQNVDLNVIFSHSDSSVFSRVFKSHSVTFMSRQSNLLIYKSLDSLTDLGVDLHTQNNYLIDILIE